jgi:DNA repair protein RadA/Sms
MKFIVKDKKTQKRIENSIKSQKFTTWKPSTVKMNDIKFDKNLFVPMPTGKKIDSLFSAQGGLMKGTNYAIVGDPGVGKSTVMLDILSDLHNRGKKVLFISGEMNQIDMHGYVKRFPKFGDLPILFMGDFHDKDPLIILKSILSEGWDVVLIDSMAEVTGSIADFHPGMSGKRAETEVLNLLEKHNKAENIGKVNTAFLIIQQVTKMGEFAGSNRFKHMMTGMAHMKFLDEGRAFFFSKNRRGGQMDALFFSLNQIKNVGWLHTQPMNLVG